MIEWMSGLSTTPTPGTSTLTVPAMQPLASEAKLIERMLRFSRSRGDDFGDVVGHAGRVGGDDAQQTRNAHLRPSNASGRR